MSDDLTLDRVRMALNASPPAKQAGAAEPTAAVAAVLRDGKAGLELLFIHRAEHPRDPWSGHMAWPGGHIDSGDDGPLDAALRETREELQLDLERDGELLGSLPVVRTHVRRGRAPRHVASYVFGLHRDNPLVPNYEVQEALWVPLSFLRNRHNRRRFVWMRLGVPLALPCYRFEGKLIWGLTLVMLDHLLRRIGTVKAGTFPV